MLALKVIAALLCYPSRAMAADFPEMRAILEAERALPAEARRGIGALMDRLAAAAELDAQMAYTGLFDRSRRLSLHLFEHIHGDSRERGQALASLLEHYRSTGLDLATEELPDFLPLFLEFLSTRPGGEVRRLLGEVAPIVALVGARLEARGSDYAAAFHALVALAGARVDVGEIRRRVADERRDDTPEALDVTWEDGPVDFGAPAEGAPPNREGGKR